LQIKIKLLIIYINKIININLLVT